MVRPLRSVHHRSSARPSPLLTPRPGPCLHLCRPPDLIPRTCAHTPGLPKRVRCGWVSGSRLPVSVHGLPRTHEPMKQMPMGRAAVSPPPTPGGCRPPSNDEERKRFFTSLTSSPTPPLRKHQPGQESDGQTGSWCLDKAVQPRSARYQKKACPKSLPMAAGFGMGLGFLFLGTKLSSTISLVK